VTITTRIEVAYFKLPVGDRTAIIAELPESYAHAAASILDAGLEPQAEVLSTAELSVTLTDPELGDYAIEIVHLATGALAAALATMLDRFDRDDLERWREVKRAAEAADS
jgi:hypothetical protein